MPIQQKAFALLGRPVGVSLMDGTGVSGILCSVDGGSIYIIEYLYHTQFATKHYTFGQVRDILPYPQCPRPYPSGYQEQPVY